MLTVPDDWSLLPPGDAALSRRIKQDGPTWTVIEQGGIEALRAEREIGRQDPAYQKKLAAGRARRAEEQAEYVEDFLAEVRRFLAFHPRYEAEERVMAEAIAAHATPVGSGTVARTERIPIEERAEAATIAWMRHQTTGYDHMTIARVKGERREVRRELARQSVRLLERYRSGMDIDPVHCPLQRALKSRRAE